MSICKKKKKKIDNLPRVYVNTLQWTPGPREHDWLLFPKCAFSEESNRTALRPVTTPSLDIHNGRLGRPETKRK